MFCNNSNTKITFASFNNNKNKLFMKMRLILTLAVGAILGGCGDKFTPLTQEQITAKVDSTVAAQSEAKLAELKAACDAGLEAQVNAKVESLKAAAEGTAETK
jgi:hypothetical protein